MEAAVALIMTKTRSPFLSFMSLTERGGDNGRKRAGLGFHDDFGNDGAVDDFFDLSFKLIADAESFHGKYVPSMHGFCRAPMRVISGWQILHSGWLGAEPQCCEDAKRDKDYQYDELV
jgi:hypothetical protein